MFSTSIDVPRHAPNPSTQAITLKGFGFRLVPRAGWADFPVRVQLDGVSYVVPDWGWVATSAKSLQLVPPAGGTSASDVLGFIDTAADSRLEWDPGRYVVMIAESASELLSPVGIPAPTLEQISSGTAGIVPHLKSGTAAPGAGFGFGLGRSVKTVRILANNLVGQTVRVWVGDVLGGQTAPIWYDGGIVLDGSVANQCADLQVYVPGDPISLGNPQESVGRFQQRLYLQNTWSILGIGIRIYAARRFGS